jgi:hypothetical protein
MATQRAGNGSNDEGEETEGTQWRQLPSRSLRDVMAQVQATRGDRTTGSRRQRGLSGDALDRRDRRHPHTPPAVRDLTCDGRWSTYDVSVLKLSNVSFRGKCACLGNTRWRERGWESPNSDEGKYTVVLFIYIYLLLLCALPYGSNVLLVLPHSEFSFFRPFKRSCFGDYF